MKQNSKKIIKIIGFIFLIIAIFSICLGVWLYTGALTNAKLKTFSLLPLPIALVNGRPIAASQFIFRYNLAQTVLSQNFSNQPTGTVSADIMNQLISERKTELLALTKNISVSPQQLDQQYTSASLNANLEGKANFNQLLESYGISPTDYQNQIIQPQVLLTNLQTWFYSQTGLNSDAYAQAGALLTKIQSGQDMGSLAAATTQDSSQKATEGDLGFVDITQLLPELRQAVGSMKVGDVKVLPSRYGINILKLEAKNGNRLDLRQIFLQGTNFQIWYNNETNGYKVQQLIKI